MRKAQIVLLTIVCILVLSVFSKPVREYLTTSSYELKGPVNVISADKFKKFALGAKRATQVNLHIEGEGGLVLSMNKILYYMNQIDAPTYCTIDSHAASADAVIMSHCDKIKVAPKAVIMFHVMQVCTKQDLFSRCTKREAANKKDNPEEYKASVEMLQQAKVFLTRREWKELMSGKDVYIVGDTLMRRLKVLGRAF